MKKVLSIALLITLLLANVSCSSSKPSANTDNTTGNTADTTTEAAETDIYDSLPKRDLNGMEIKIFGYGASQSYVDSETFEAEQTGEPIDDAVYQRNIDTENRLGIKIVYDYSFSERDSVSTFTQSIMAGDDLCDTYAIKAVDAGQIITSGTVMPWNDIKGINLDNPWYVQDANEQIKLGESQYGILSDACATNTTMCWVWVFNKRLIDEWNVEDPYSMVKSGSWTMDNAYAITKDIWSDLNGNNEHDAEDLYGFYTDAFASIDAFMVSHGIHSMGRDENNYPTLDFYSEKLVTSFEKIYNLYWNNPGAYVDTAQPYEYRVQFANGQSVFSPMLLNYLIGTDLRSMKDDYGVLPYPKFDEEQEDYMTHMLGRTGVLFLPINISGEKQEVIGDGIECLSAYSYKYMRPAIYDVSLTGKGVRDDDSIEMLNLIMDSRTYDFSMFLEASFSFPFSPMNAFRNNLAKKDINITSFYDSKKSSAESFLEDLIEKIQEQEK